ncbi:hypothetical protein OWR28_12385 [Chryseobacterium sp. 1B4]
MKKFITNIVAVSSLFLAAQQLSAQKVVVNREVDTQNDGKMLLGNQLKEQFLKAPYADWYVKEHDEYVLDQKAVSELKKRKSGLMTSLFSWEHGVKTATEIFRD